jgi:poly(beta-D-mannuronate) lyase
MPNFCEHRQRFRKNEFNTTFVKTRYLLFTFFLLLRLVNVSQAASTLVNSLAALTSAYTNARPGDTVIVANGTYNWGEILLVNTNGTSTSQWIVLKAERISEVNFTGSTYIKFSGTRVRIDGFRFMNGNAGTNPVISFRSSSTVLANYSRVSNITIDNYNTLSPDTTVENEWIGFFGVRNRLDHCTFINKSNPRATVVIWYSTATFPDKSVSTYHLIDSNYFLGRSYMGGNGGETIRVGVGNNSRTDGFNIIEYNLFENCIQKDPEIVSNKSFRNTYRYNTFKNCNGGLTLRMGRYCEVYGNFFIVTDATKTDSYGVRVIDKGHRVTNNYFEGLLGGSGSLTNMRAPITLFNGSYASADSLNPGVLNGEYFPADSAVIAYNTVVNCSSGAGIRLGYTNYGANTYQPRGIRLGNNIIKMSAGQVIDLNAANTTLTYFAEGNLYNAPGGLGLSNTAGFTSHSLIFGTRSAGILPPPQTGIQDASVNTGFYATMLLGLDAQRQNRSSVYDIGCDELNGTGSVVAAPLDSTKVGSGKGVVSAAQTISFPALSVKSLGEADFDPGATASSGLAVTYTSSNPGVATIVNGKIRIVGSGLSVITASQSGNANYDSAVSVRQNFIVRTNYSYAPSKMTVLGGSGCVCTSGTLATNDASYYTVASTTKSTRKTDWYGSVVIGQPASTINKITIYYDGKNSSAKTQVLYLYNWVSSSWIQIDSRSVSTADVTVSFTLSTSPANYVSSAGEIRLRVYSSGGTSNYTCSGDWMQFIVESSALPVAAPSAGAVQNLITASSGAQKTESVKNIFDDAAPIVLGQNIPNPFKSEAYIPLHIPYDCSSASLLITNAHTGQFVKLIPVKPGEARVHIDAAGYAAGIYVYTLYVNGKAAAARKLVVGR